MSGKPWMYITIQIVLFAGFYFGFFWANTQNRTTDIFTRAFFCANSWAWYVTRIDLEGDSQTKLTLTPFSKKRGSKKSNLVKREKKSSKDKKEACPGALSLGKQSEKNVLSFFNSLKKSIQQKHISFLWAEISRSIDIETIIMVFFLTLGQKEQNNEWSCYYQENSY